MLWPPMVSMHSKYGGICCLEMPFTRRRRLYVMELCFEGRRITLSRETYWRSVIADISDMSYQSTSWAQSLRLDLTAVRS